MRLPFCGLRRWRPWNYVFNRLSRLCSDRDSNRPTQICWHARLRYVFVFVALFVLTISFVAKVLVENHLVSQNVGAVKTAAKSSNPQFVWLKNVVIFGPSPNVRKPEFLVLKVEKARFVVIQGLPIFIADTSDVQRFFRSNISWPLDWTITVNIGEPAGKIVVRKLIVNKEGHSAGGCASDILPFRDHDIAEQCIVCSGRDYLKIVSKT